MQPEKHPEFDLENNRLKKTIFEMESYLTTAKDRTNSGGDAWSQRNLVNFNREIVSKYNKNIESPYFIRIDFLNTQTNSNESFYIGYAGLNNGEYQVYDWRSPLGSLISSQPNLKNSALHWQGIIELRRRFDIHKVIRDIDDEFDYRKSNHTDNNQLLSANTNQFLIDQVNKRGHDQIHNIVSTMQSEQDLIMRMPSDKLLLINGVAGSGKTSIALHRLAYLLYKNNNFNLRSENSIVFCPNQFFITYIQELLPELGEENVKHQVFKDWLLERSKISNDAVINYPLMDEVEKPNEKILHRLNRTKILSKSKTLKLIENYIEYLSNNPVYIPRDFSFELANSQIITLGSTEINTIVKDLLGNHETSLQKKGSQFRLIIKKVLGEKFDKSIDNLTLSLKLKAKELVDHAKSEHQNDGEYVRRASEEANLLLKKARDTRNTAYVSNQNHKIIDICYGQIEDQLKEVWHERNWVALYLELFKNIKLLNLLAGNLFKVEEINSLNIKTNVDLRIGEEDITCFYYFIRLLTGENQPIFDYIIVDESQDFTPVQLLLMTKLVKNLGITIVGDLTQNITNDLGINDWSELLSELNSSNYRKYNLQHSYRSSRQIVNLSNHIYREIFPNSNFQAIPLERSRNEPKFINSNGIQSTIKIIYNEINILRSNDYKQIAIITKDQSEANELHHHIFGDANYQNCLTYNPEKKTVSFLGAIILPIELSKGLEFEAVIISNASESRFSGKNPRDGRLLYVAITRALHELRIIHTGQISPFFKGIIF